MKRTIPAVTRLFVVVFLMLISVPSFAAQVKADVDVVGTAPQKKVQDQSQKKKVSQKIDPKKVEDPNSQVLRTVSGDTKSLETNFEAFQVDVEEKRKGIVALVKRGIEYLTTHRPEEAFHTFMHNRNFVKGDVSLFVFDTDGNVYVPEENLTKVWANIKDFKNAHGVEIADLMIKKALKGGGWIDYERQNDYKSSYIEKVEKDGVSYIIGAGWYSESKKLAVESIVKSAVDYFIKRGREDAFHEFSNKIGRFVRGDLYIYVYDTKGYCVAHGDNTALIGRDLINLKDDNGFLVVQALINAGKEGGGWVSYQWKNAPKVGYVEAVKDNTGTYIIGSGYYPEARRTTVVSLVKRGEKYFNAWGREKASIEFNSKVGEFVYGDLSLFMYDFDGKVLAQGDNPELKDQNIIDLRSPDGSYIIKNLIDAAQQGGGWVSYKWRNDLSLTYVEKVSDKQGNYLIGCGFYPDTARTRVEELVRSGIGYVRVHTFPASMRAFGKRSGDFVKGPLDLFVFNKDGDCLLYGDEYPLIWKNFKNFKDVEGKYVLGLLMHKAQRGGGWVEYKSKNATKMAYVQMIEKDGVPYLIGSAFYK